MQLNKEQVVNRLLEKRLIDPETSCWLWTGNAPVGRGGLCYGHIGINRKTYRVHRLSAYIYLDLNIDNEKLYVCHKCDNPRCFNPEHLFIGTQSDNMKDCVQKGRANKPYGARINTVKLTEEDVFLVCKLREQGLTYKAIAERFDVNLTAISKICTGQNWKHITRERY